MIATICPSPADSCLCACANALMLMRQYGHQWPRWKVTATGARFRSSSSLTIRPISSGRTNGGIGSPILGADFTGAVLAKPLYEPIHGRSEFRPLSPYCRSEGAKLLLQG